MAIEKTYSRNFLLAVERDKLVRKGYIKLSKVTGRKLIDKDYGAATTLSPTEEIFMHVITYNVDEVNDIDLFYEIEFTFYCKFYNRKIVDVST